MSEPKVGATSTAVDNRDLSRDAADDDQELEFELDGAFDRLSAGESRGALLGDEPDDGWKVIVRLNKGDGKEGEADAAKTADAKIGSF